MANLSTYSASYFSKRRFVTVMYMLTIPRIQFHLAKLKRMEEGPGGVGGEGETFFWSNSGGHIYYTNKINRSTGKFK